MLLHRRLFPLPVSEYPKGLAGLGLGRCATGGSFTCFSSCELVWHWVSGAEKAKSFSPFFFVPVPCYRKIWLRARTLVSKHWVFGWDRTLGGLVYIYLMPGTDHSALLSPWVGSMSLELHPQIKKGGSVVGWDETRSLFRGLGMGLVHRQEWRQQGKCSGLTA